MIDQGHPTLWHHCKLREIHGRLYYFWKCCDKWSAKVQFGRREENMLLEYSKTVPDEGIGIVPESLLKLRSSTSIRVLIGTTSELSCMPVNMLCERFK
jgi:hypothetical protein